MCCSVLQCVAVCYQLRSQYVTVCCSNLQCVHSEDLSVLQCVAVCCVALRYQLRSCVA